MRKPFAVETLLFTLLAVEQFLLALKYCPRSGCTLHLLAHCRCPCHLLGSAKGAVGVDGEACLLDPMHENSSRVHFALDERRDERLISRQCTR